MLLVRYRHQLPSKHLPLVRRLPELDPSAANSEVCRMNIAEGEDQIIEARTCGDQNKRVAYKFMDGFHSLCLDKRDIMLGEIGACELLLRACRDDADRKAVEKEIAELKMALDLMP